MTKIVRIMQPQIKSIGCGVSDHTRRLTEAFGNLGTTSTVHDAHSSQLLLTVPSGPESIWLLQLSMYGYQKKGTPLWLPRNLKRFVRNGQKIGIYFHETWVPKAQISSSAFWLAPFQKEICQELLRLSHAAYFNTNWGFEWGRRNKEQNVHFAPTFSTIGEPIRIPPFSARSDSIACFGRPQNREDIYRTLEVEFGKSEAGKPPLKLVDIGIGSDFASSIGKLLPFEFNSLGPASDERIRETLIKCRYGLFNTPWSVATKSSVFGAYVAHGVIPVSIHNDDNLPLGDSKAGNYSMEFLPLDRWLATIENQSTSQCIALQELIHRNTDRYFSASQLAAQVLEDFQD